MREGGREGEGGEGGREGEREGGREGGRELVNREVYEARPKNDAGERERGESVRQKEEKGRDGMQRN